MASRKDTEFEVLVLGGTAEARALSRRLGRDVRLSVRTAPDLKQVGVGSAQLVVDARHPFATGVSQAGVPVLRLWRPEWRAGSGDRWTEVPDGRAAAAMIPRDACVFVATGRGRLAELEGLRDNTVWWRRRGPVDAGFPFAKGGWLTEEGPFSEEEERALFERLGVDWLVVQNAGGKGAYPKLAAARALGLRVGMIARPMRPEPWVATPEEAEAWVRAEIASLDSGA